MDLELKQRFRIAAIKKNQRLQDAAEEIGVSLSTLSQVINGKICAVETAKKIEAWSEGQITAAELLGV